VEEPGGVQRRVGGVGRQGEGQAARYEAVEGGVQVAGAQSVCAQRQSGQADAPCGRIDLARERHGRRVEVGVLLRRRAFAFFQHGKSGGVETEARSKGALGASI
jgi:hypothetical protein